jgi:hypothetical protein
MITRRDKLLTYPRKETDTLCLYCLSPVNRISLPNECVLLLCECYSRLFEPGNNRHNHLSQTLWSEFIEKSQKRNPHEHCFVQAFQEPIINLSTAPNYDCWCPGCQRNRHLGGRSVWLSHQGNYVATYGLCRPCAIQLSDPVAEGQNAAQRYEDNLLVRYPFLHDRLSK